MPRQYGPALIKSGDKFHQLTAVSVVPGHERLWNCDCDCGGAIQVIESKLRMGQRRTCHKTGKPADITGRTYGYLTALKFVRNSKEPGVFIWLFKCICGNEVEKKSRNAVKGDVKSCGCKTGEMISTSQKKPNGRAVKHASYLHHLNGANKRNIKSCLSEEEYTHLTSKPCHYCGDISNRKNNCTGEIVPCNSVDRLNNESYYTLDNSVPACFTCQSSKMEASEDAYLKKISQIFHYRGLT